jgi:hypothetical protein
VRRLLIAVVVILLIALASAAWAQPSLIGPSGLMRTPTAGTLDALQFNVGVSNMWADGGPDESYVYANVGLTSRLELGITRAELEDVEAETLLNVKFRFLGPIPGKLTLAAGATDITDQVDQSAYVVLTHEIGAGAISSGEPFTHPQVHFGAGSGQLDGLFGGLSVTYAGKTDLMLEYDGSDVNMGLRHVVLPRLSLAAAALGTFDDLALGLYLASPW